MFGCIVAGRLIQTQPEQVDGTHYIFNIESLESVNHVIVFMLGTVAFPEGMGGAVYFSWPSQGGENHWQLLGTISNLKPSAIFKVSGVKGEETTTGLFGAGFGIQQNPSISQIGISIELLSQLEQQTPSASAKVSTIDSFTEFSTKMLENLFNFASSFAVSQAQMTPQPNETFVPSSILSLWYNNFQRRLSQNPNFWKS